MSGFNPPKHCRGWQSMDPYSRKLFTLHHSQHSARFTLDHFGKINSFHEGCSEVDGFARGNIFSSFQFAAGEVVKHECEVAALRR